METPNVPITLGALFSPRDEYFLGDTLGEKESRCRIGAPDVLGVAGEVINDDDFALAGAGEGCYQHRTSRGKWIVC